LESLFDCDLIHDVIIRLLQLGAFLEALKFPNLTYILFFQNIKSVVGSGEQAEHELFPLINNPLLISSLDIF
jgi:hypothetical protein